MCKEARKKIKLNFGRTEAILIAVFAALLAADLVLKYVAYKFNWNFVVIPALIEVVPMQMNHGAAFSFLAEKEWGRALLIVLTSVMLAVMIFLFFILPKRFVALKTALSMISAGALGNLIDRIIFGAVRDFVDIYMLRSWACCNFADFWIVFGVILAIIDMLFLNDWAVIPLTKSAKAAQKKREEEGENQSSDNTSNGDKEEEKQPSDQTADDNDGKKQSSVQTDGDDKEGEK